LQKTRFILGILSIAVLLTACEKTDKLWELPPPGSETLASVNMGPAYDNSIFFTLKNGATAVRNVYSWHLAFACGADEHHIILNGGNEVQIHQTNDTAFEKTYTVNTGTEWIWDNPNGDKDSTAFAGWFDTVSQTTRNKVYILDLGSRVSKRFKKIKILSVSGAQYHVKYANADGTEERELVIEKTPGTNFSYMNMETVLPVMYEPQGTPWDILFTKYRHIYYDMEPVTPYYVTGVLINSKYVMVTETQTLSFDEIDVVKARGLLLTSKEDEIGYDWKFYDLSGTGKYSVNSKKVFVLKDKDGYFYKLRFVDFYDENGTKGVPKFAYQRL
jgi:hypothetical protein